MLTSDQTATTATTQGKPAKILEISRIGPAIWRVRTKHDRYGLSPGFPPIVAL
jgi:hypothetical protein